MHIGGRRRKTLGGGRTRAGSTLTVDRIAQQNSFGPREADRSVADTERDDPNCLTHASFQAHRSCDASDREIAWPTGHFGKAPYPAVIIGHAYFAEQLRWLKRGQEWTNAQL